MILYYIRHGDPIYNPDSLTELGKRQAEAVAKRLSLHGIDEIYSSTSARAKQTAQPLSEILKLPITELEWCNEGHAWGEFTVKENDGRLNWMFSNDDVRKAFREKEVLALGNEWYKHPFFDKKVGDGVKRINTEIDNFMKSFGYVHDRENGVYKVTQKCEKRIALFAHQGFAMAFFSGLLDIPYPIFSTHFDISHSSMSVIHFSDNGNETVPKVLELSNDSHLYKEGLPTKYCNSFYI